MRKKPIQSGLRAGFAVFMPLTLLGFYLQNVWAVYQNGNSILAAIVQPIWLAVVSPFILLVAEGDRQALFVLFLNVFLKAMGFAALASVVVGIAIYHATKNQA